jgi:sn-glycerol 3-phosphate transport system substrate-binding protein
MRSWSRTAGAVSIALIVGAGLVGIPGATPAGAADSCPLAALKKAKKPVEITMWHSMPRQNGETLRALTDEFNASQTDVKVNLVDQVTYEDTFTKYKAGLSSGDLPDVVQLQGEDQQQMIDTRTVLPASVCAKADKYSFSDFLPRVVSFYTVRGTMYAMPFNTSGPVLFYDKNAFRKAGLDPEAPPKTLADVRAASEKLKSSGAVKIAGLGLKVDPGYFQQWRALAGKLTVNNSNGRKARATKAVFNDASGREIFKWMSDMVKDGLAETNPQLGSSAFDDLTGIGNGNHAMAIDTSAALGTVETVLAGGGYPDFQLGIGPMPAPTGNGAVSVQGGELFIVNKSAPEKQAAAWQYLKFLDTAESQATWAAGTGYLPIVKKAAASAKVRDLWAKSPGYKVAYDQLLKGSNNAATAGAVIGPSPTVADIVRDAENSMFLQSTKPDQALKDAATKATAAIVDYNDRVPAG